MSIRAGHRLQPAGPARERLGPRIASLTRLDWK